MMKQNEIKVGDVLNLNGKKYTVKNERGAVGDCVNIWDVEGVRGAFGVLILFANGPARLWFPFSKRPTETVE